MEAILYCRCQSRMEVSDGKARCRNSACKNYCKEFHAPDLDLREVMVPVVSEIPAPISAEAEFIANSPGAEDTSDKA